jgi:Flp pilus assembly pilin Flp
VKCRKAERDIEMPRKSFRRSTLSPTLVLLRARDAAEDDGVTAIEYALIAAGIGAAVAATVWGLGSSASGLYAGIAAIFP